MVEAASGPSPTTTGWTRRPWLLAFVGVGLAIAANCFNLDIGRTSAESFFSPFCFLLLVAALLLSARAAEQALRRFQENWDTRLEAASLLGLVSLVPLLGWPAMHSHGWDSGRMLMTALILVSLVATFLVLMPRTPRLAAISVLILFHFGGILTATVNVDPPGLVGSWLANRVWIYVYRPYLNFMYLGNAYHFYSPEPGRRPWSGARSSTATARILAINGSSSPTARPARCPCIISTCWP